jgi:hypothetical protein
MIVLWNAIYIEAALNQLRAEGYPVKDEDAYRLSPLQPRKHQHAEPLFIFDAEGSNQRRIASTA